MRSRFLCHLCAGALVLAAGCSPARLDEAAKVLADIDAGWGPSALKAETAAPNRRPVAYAIEERQRNGDLYTPTAPARAAMVLVPGVGARARTTPGWSPSPTPWRGPASRCWSPTLPDCATSR